MSARGETFGERPVVPFRSLSNPSPQVMTQLHQQRNIASFEAPCCNILTAAAHGAPQTPTVCLQDKDAMTPYVPCKGGRTLQKNEISEMQDGETMMMTPQDTPSQYTRRRSSEGVPSQWTDSASKTLLYIAQRPRSEHSGSVCSREDSVLLSAAMALSSPEESNLRGQDASTAAQHFPSDEVHQNLVAQFSAAIESIDLMDDSLSNEAELCHAKADSSCQIREMPPPSKSSSFFAASDTLNSDPNLCTTASPHPSGVKDETREGEKPLSGVPFMALFREQFPSSVLNLPWKTKTGCAALASSSIATPLEGKPLPPTSISTYSATAPLMSTTTAGNDSGVFTNEADAASSPVQPQSAEMATQVFRNSFSPPSLFRQPGAVSSPGSLLHSPPCFFQSGDALRAEEVHGTSASTPRSMGCGTTLQRGLSPAYHRSCSAASHSVSRDPGGGGDFSTSTPPTIGDGAATPPSPCTPLENRTPGLMGLRSPNSYEADLWQSQSRPHHSRPITPQKSIHRSYSRQATPSQTFRSKVQSHSYETQQLSAIRGNTGGDRQNAPSHLSMSAVVVLRPERDYLPPSRNPFSRLRDIGTQTFVARHGDPSEAQQHLPLSIVPAAFSIAMYEQMVPQPHEAPYLQGRRPHRHTAAQQSLRWDLRSDGNASPTTNREMLTDELPPHSNYAVLSSKGVSGVGWPDSAGAPALEEGSASCTPLMRQQLLDLEEQVSPAYQKPISDASTNGANLQQLIFSPPFVMRTATHQPANAAERMPSSLSCSFSKKVASSNEHEVGATLPMLRLPNSVSPVIQLEERSYSAEKVKASSVSPMGDEMTIKEIGEALTGVVLESNCVADRSCAAITATPLQNSSSHFQSPIQLLATLAGRVDATCSGDLRHNGGCDVAEALYQRSGKHQATDVKPWHSPPIYPRLHGSERHMIVRDEQATLSWSALQPSLSPIPPFRCLMNLSQSTVDAEGEAEEREGLRATDFATEDESEVHPGDRFAAHHGFQFLHYIPELQTPDGFVVPLNVDVNGVVWLATHRQDGIAYAVKEVPSDAFNRAELHCLNLSMKTEMSSFTEAEDFLARYYSCTTPPHDEATPPVHLLQMEYFPCGSLGEYVASVIAHQQPLQQQARIESSAHQYHQPRTISATFWKTVVEHGLRGLRVLHQNNLIHGYPLPCAIFLHCKDGSLLPSALSDEDTYDTLPADRYSFKLSNFGHACHHSSDYPSSHLPQWMQALNMWGTSHDNSAIAVEFTPYEAEVRIFCCGILQLMYQYWSGTTASTEVSADYATVETLRVTEIGGGEAHHSVTQMLSFFEALTKQPSNARYPGSTIRLLLDAYHKPHSAEALLHQLQVPLSPCLIAAAQLYEVEIARLTQKLLRARECAHRKKQQRICSSSRKTTPLHAAYVSMNTATTTSTSSSSSEGPASHRPSLGQSLSSQSPCCIEKREVPHVNLSVPIKTPPLRAIPSAATPLMRSRSGVARTHSFPAHPNFLLTSHSIGRTTPHVPRAAVAEVQQPLRGTPNLSLGFSRRNSLLPDATDAASTDGACDSLVSSGTKGNGDPLPLRVVGTPSWCNTFEDLSLECSGANPPKERSVRQEVRKAMRHVIETVFRGNGGDNLSSALWPRLWLPIQQKMALRGWASIHRGTPCRSSDATGVATLMEGVALVRPLTSYE